MAQSFRQLFLVFSLVGLFVFAIFSFVAQIESDNDVTDTITNNPVINRTFGNLSTNLSSQRDDVQTQKESYESEIPERGFGTLIIFSIVTVVQKFGNVVVGTYNILIVLPASVLGVPNSVLSVFTGILLVTLLILGWRVIRSGD